MPSPLSVTTTAIPEITLLIARHLCKPDLSSCSLVCRAWSRVYIPLLWRDLHAHVPDVDPLPTITIENTPSNSPVSLLLRNGWFIKTLSIVDSNPDRPCVSELIYDLPSVQNLIRLTASSIQYDIISPTRNIVHRNSDTLRVLWLVFHRSKIQKMTGWRGTTLFEFPSRMPLLESLYLQHWQLSRKQLILILKACPSLKLLSFDIHITGGHGDKDIANGTAERENECYRDKDKETGGHGENDIANGPADQDDAYYRDKDEEAVFQHQGIETFRMCSRLYMIMEHLPRVKLLEFYRPGQHAEAGDLQGSSDMATVLSILDHASTLEEANLADYTEKTFLPLQFLESCPRLKMFWTGHSMTTMTQVQESIERGWVCQDLTELRLSIFKLSPLLIEAIMQELGAEREPDSRTSTIRARVIKQGQIMGLEQQQLQRQQELDLQAAIDLLLPEQKAFQKQLAGFLKGLVNLRRLNFGTGWYRVERS
ncbi:hypothetical protein KVV02_008292 [Mortierella alpina]|uniref:F-box domain-containing protein n=1 Tax=Mortierella alpina TaxID=64518 RepID=A0A9P7ZX09_MORAP|nr:hypothetical protein KVV02_008292 [Mortierella alpina]